MTSNSIRNPQSEIRNGEPCPLCGGESPVRMFAAAHDWLMRCPACGLGFARPQPTDAELAEIYGSDYYAQFGYRGGGDAGLRATKRATYARLLRQAERWVRPGRLLDVGCGLGYSLEEAGRHGWRATGLEPHALAGQGTTPQAGIEVVRGDLDTFHPNEPFNLVTLVDVIEHVRDPVATIRQAGELLADDGALLLATNNLAHWTARRLGPRWVHFHRAHLWYFSPATLAMAVARAGLTALGQTRAWRVYNLDYVCGILAGGTAGRDNELEVSFGRGLARWVLRGVPRPLRLLPWPALPEGMVLIAGRAR